VTLTQADYQFNLGFCEHLTSLSSLSRLGTGTSIKSGGAKLVLLSQTPKYILELPA